MDSSFGNLYPVYYHNNDIFMILKFVLESSSPVGSHDFKNENNALTKAFLRSEFLVEAVVRNLNFSILNQLSGSVKKISA